MNDKNIILDIYNKIAEKSPIHAKKLKKNMKHYNDVYFQRSDDFIIKYLKFLNTLGKDIDYSIDCYLKMLDDIIAEDTYFKKFGKYSSSSFEEVNNRVYGNPNIMEYYMHGLLISQFLWKQHYQIYNYFIENIKEYSNSTNSYLEIGAGHGLYLSEAVKILDKNAIIDVVDISESSINLAKNLINNDRINFTLANIFDFNSNKKYDFITMGEVLEHVENPLSLLLKLNELLNKNGTLYITAPTNAPTIDHIYLFKNINEIKSLLNKAGFKIEKDIYFYAEDLPEEMAEKMEIALMYGAFLKKI
ncbi:MAG: hypothetical protein A2X12_07335 [Bacteroidetes bacterium GWE2_29_8]|nr:MAG: hypothetical protein A2X12_07335 [Bacteroidetes bacterium GWE2_29_8]OFY24581.1 MAG: hypothetical protein A2X02_03185 [Bacteroidetes bacterium GWF2_29_10]